ncbi:MAG TPA: isocitrate lyase/phosphoenolpyruvate mutase family protein, partial [Myxococcota bacterium]|nr:isocitrate lyase/phosphoenolpyruvate mutase family protein [Myxococcota bacterium]
ETVTRAGRYRAAGANSIFVPGVSEEALIARLVGDVGLPLNVLVWPGLPPTQKLRALGVRRLSAGAGLAKVALNRVHAMSAAFLADGRSEPFSEGSLRSPEINAMMRPA